MSDLGLARVFEALQLTMILHHGPNKIVAIKSRHKSNIISTGPNVRSALLALLAWCYQQLDEVPPEQLDKE